MRLELKDTRQRIPFLSLASELVLYIPFESDAKNIPSNSPLVAPWEIDEIVCEAIPREFFFFNKKEQIVGMHLLESNIRLSIGLVKELTTLENFEGVMNNFLVSLARFFTDKGFEFKYQIQVEDNKVDFVPISFRINENEPIRGMLSSFEQSNNYSFLVDVVAEEGEESFNEFLELDYIKARIKRYLAKKMKDDDRENYIKEIATNLVVVDNYVCRQYDNYRYIRDLQDVAPIVKILCKHSEKYTEYLINQNLLLAKYVESGEEHVDDIDRIFTNFAVETNKVYKKLYSKLTPEEIATNDVISAPSN